MDLSTTSSHGRIAIIDLGTNSVRFDVYQLGEKGVASRLRREKLSVRLGEGVFLKGRLAPDAVRRTLQALRRFQSIADEYRVDRTVAFATATLREVDDAPEFLRAAKAEAGVNLRVIPGEEEARLIALGILLNEKKAGGRVALVDIGGGSTEISICEARQILHCSSFSLGTARLQQVFLKSIPPRSTRGGGTPSIERLREHIRSVLLPRKISERWPSVKKIIGSSGAIRALSKIAVAETGEKAIRKQFLRRLVKRMSGMSAEKLAKIPGMERKRIDLILSGAILLEECMEILGADRALPTPYTLRDGIVVDQTRRLPLRSLDFNGDLFPLFAKACRLGCEEANLKILVRNAELLFGALEGIHCLPQNWKDLFLMAIIFRDTGWVVSPIDHEKHSYYIVKNTELPVSEAWEIEFVGQLCLRHESGKIDPEDPIFEGDQGKERRRAFRYLVPLLRVIDGLDPAHQEKIILQSVSLTPKSVRLRVSSESSAELAKMRIEQKSELFHKVFERGLVVEAV